ncbi:MAG: hypothetical protein IJV56_07165, partial [Neisseriaceae bacterium]|nr:hypothetical protein [Neisseriaceae bacterium]
KAIHQNKTALFEEYHRMTYRPSHTENGVTYFTGGFTYLNEKQENTMKTPLEVIAEVMNKYETHIDSENGLMNKPLNQLSPQELEDRLTVAAARESRAIQYGDEPDDMHRLHNDLSKSFAEIIKLSKQTDQESRSKLATSQEEMLNVLKVIQDAGMSLRYMPVAGLNNPVIENLITQAETFEQPKQQEQTMKTENSVPENTIKQDTFGLSETTEPRLGDKVILQNGVFYPVISRIADEKFSLGRNAPNKDFIDTIKTNGEIPVSVDEYKQIAKMKNELWYCENTKEFVFMGGVENNYMFRNIRNEEYYGLKEFLQQLKDRQPETVKTLNPKEQALEDGKRLNQAAEKVKNAQWACAKKPNDKECYDNLKVALAEQAALNEEIKPKVQAAMDSGKPYIVDYSEDGKPLELVVTQNGNLKMALGSYEKEPNHNHLLSTGNGEVALNAEQRSTPERVAEVLKYNFNQATTDIGEKLALISYPDGDKVFSEQEIKDTLNKALRSSFKEDQLAAIKSPVMRGEWLQSIAANPKALDEIRQAAKNEMAERYGTAEPTVEQATETIGVSSPEHEEELATVADDDYERD